MMKAIAIIAGVCLFGATYRILERPSAPAIQEKDPAQFGLVFLDREPNLGTVGQGGRCSYKVKVVNQSGQSVSILNVSVSCDCMTVEPQRATLAPAEVLEFNVSVDLAHDPAFVGDLCLTVHLNTQNGPTVSSSAFLSVRSR